MTTSTDPGLAFPAGFRWGTATSAFQIEGAADQDGRTPSIWDTFARVPGKIRDGSNGDIACDHYHRHLDDLELLTRLGVGVYRFSVSWSRVRPAGTGPVNAKGLAFYDQLIDALLARGIEPAVTLFHWDLPQELEDAGGWRNRATAEHFADYASTVAAVIGDRVGLWITLNEPVVHATLGHLLGIHAPGRTNRDDLLPVVHHQLLGHGLAAAAVRSHSAAPVALTNAYSPGWAVDDSGDPTGAGPADRAAAAAFDALHNHLYTDPVLLGRYPDQLADQLTAVAGLVRDGDLATIAAPLDVLGVNYYFPMGVTTGGGDFETRTVTGYPRTAFDWPVVPHALRDQLISMRDRYGSALPPIWITENGCAYDDVPTADGSIDDTGRIAYYDGHLRAVREAIDAGVDVQAYCAWSLLDNWEWAEGYTKRFGLVHVDYPTQRREPKASFHWYRRLIEGQHLIRNTG